MSNSGDIVALPDAPGRADFLGAVVPLRGLRDAPISPDADLSNVLSFKRRRGSLPREAPVIVADASLHPANRWNDSRLRLAALLAGSVAVHAALFVLLNREPPPLASIGVHSISVEIVLGAQTAAGLAETPSPLEGERRSDPSPQESKPQDVKTEAARPDPKAKDAETVEAAKGSDEVKTAELEQKPVVEPVKPAEEIKPTEETKPAEGAKPVEEAKAPEPEIFELKPVAAAELPTEPQKIERAQPKVEPPREAVPPPPAVKKEQPAVAKETPKKPRENKRASNDGKDARDRTPASSEARTASSGVGIGRSDSQTNYNGLVGAHLARYKRYPSDARVRGEQGHATVTFKLDGGGAVTSVRLAKGSGFATLDQEAVATVNRASPFPEPPNQRSQEFTIRLDFDIR
jgi:periplasmic protein TonB